MTIFSASSRFCWVLCDLDPGRPFRSKMTSPVLTGDDRRDIILSHIRLPTGYCYASYISSMSKGSLCISFHLYKMQDIIKTAQSSSRQSLNCDDDLSSYGNQRLNSGDHQARIRGFLIHQIVSESITVLLSLGRLLICSIVCIRRIFYPVTRLLGLGLGLRRSPAWVVAKRQDHRVAHKLDSLHDTIVDLASIIHSI